MSKPLLSDPDTKVNNDELGVVNAAAKASVDVETFDRLGTGKWRGEELTRTKNTCFLGKKP